MGPTDDKPIGSDTCYGKRARRSKDYLISKRALLRYSTKQRWRQEATKAVAVSAGQM